MQLCFSAKGQAEFMGFLPNAVDFQTCIPIVPCISNFLANDSMQEQVPGHNSVLEEVKASIELEEPPASQSGWFCCAA